ncbi:hypothetical protein PZ897_12960 [Hoeflea sp. YIM 152468]|uniref:hypothetical protein n=1 Tax=Hoeflea sp. YIM 152468 TaxID=3031759 RepID=UPI0023DACB04|nr:hypothetical protein [Hoeflea sp. YIM 152468]MDF1609089.1 hypothetical protein [Hoeflea sp. YIM 152468]
MKCASSGSAIRAVILGLAIAASPAHSETGVQARLSLDLNAVEQIEQACRLVFVVTNTTGKSIEEMTLETVLFDQGGKVSRFTLFDFKALPQGKPRVRQFDLPDTHCAAVARILINGAASCKGEGLTGTECIDHLDVKSSTRTEIAG